MKRIKLGEICEIVSGSTPKTGVAEYWNGDINWITPAELTDETYIIEESQRKITTTAVQKTGLRPFPKGTVILSSRAPIGKVAIAGKEMYCNQGFKNLICSDRIDSRYLYWYLKGNTDYLNSLGRGATFKEISKAIVENIEIPLPDLDEQIRCANILKKCWDLILMQKKQIEIYDILIKSQFMAMFGDRFVNSMRWPIKKLRDSMSFNNGKAHEQVVDENGEYILITSRAIASDLQDVRRTNALLFPLHKNDVVMVMSDVPNGRALAKCLLIDEDDKYTLNQRICSFDNYEFDPIYLVNLLDRHQYFLSFNDGNGQTNLRKNDILECELIVPPIGLQKQFAAFVHQTNKLKLKAKESLEKLEIMKKVLMQQYFG